MFILTADGREKSDFDRYSRYLTENAHRFPPGALELAQSSWYFGFSGQRAPHDSRLEQLVIAEGPPEESLGRDTRQPEITIRLRNAFDSGYLIFEYVGVTSYALGGSDLVGGHQDWRYDEFRLDEGGRLVHEIEWWGRGESARWVIVASDMRFGFEEDPSG